LDADVANVLGIRVGFDRRNNFIERYCDRRRSGTYMNQPRFRQQIARRNVPELAFAAIRRQLHGLTVRAVKGFENVQHGLDCILSGGHVFQARSRIALRIVADSDGLTGLPPVDGHTENHLRLNRIVDLHARLVAWIVREQKQQASVQRLFGTRGWKAHANRLSRGIGSPYQASGQQGERENEGAHTGV
jgi:hypothetical protein